MRLEISEGPLGVKFRIQGHLGVGKGEKHPLGHNCPKANATVRPIIGWSTNFAQTFYFFNILYWTRAFKAKNQELEFSGSNIFDQIRNSPVRTNSFNSRDF